jgi:hypothetical protein
MKINLKEAELEGVDWIHLAQNRGQGRALANAVMVLRVSLKVVTI